MVIDFAGISLRRRKLRFNWYFLHYRPFRNFWQQLPLRSRQVPAFRPAARAICGGRGRRQEQWAGRAGLFCVKMALESCSLLVFRAAGGPITSNIAQV